MIALTTARALSIGATLLVGLTTVHAQSYPVTATQRSTAQQVAQQGIPETDLAPNAPAQYTVKRGDTLWGISGLYLRQPWRWPELWGMNLSSISNPHQIFPGQVLYLVRSNGYARLSTTGPNGDSGVVRLSPQTRESSLKDLALPTLPPHLIEPFLAEPLVVGLRELDQAPRIIATMDKRVLMASGDRAYVRNSGGAIISSDKGQPTSYRIFRDATPLIDPVTRIVLGYEAKYLGSAAVVRGETIVDTIEGEPQQSTPATVDITRSKNEIRAGDRLLASPEQQYLSYVPHAPSSPTTAAVVSIYGDSVGANAAQNQIIAINKGSKDGVDVGTVLELVSKGDVIVDKTSPNRSRVKLPDEQNGYAMVFRVFDQVSYALITTAQRPVNVGDGLQSPQN
ncbi:LysM peptidoglycan-binding domain-containing protein [Comamonas sp. Y33R10-2]|uniref:LysM peptidoglycan-binding domain-containing protein n=1 Tax=Comamonas sp. Y33R10-2 TaxID=2853257 RepID=UPI001C5C8CA1|nr:LysM domain-containing protein [Comamonas sp. Y33R10-2]QXZ08671.1 LysM peptidoglycan-binding domain-containing protein [Comamonas sp. Y33R10-2]